MRRLVETDPDNEQCRTGLLSSLYRMADVLNQTSTGLQESGDLFGAKQHYEEFFEGMHSPRLYSNACIPLERHAASSRISSQV